MRTDRPKRIAGVENPTGDSARPQGLIPPHDGYRELLSCRKALIVYDATVDFCKRFVDPRSGTTDQRIQSARSGKQNIADSRGTGSHANVRASSGGH